MGPIAFIVGVAGQVALLQQDGELIGAMLLSMAALLAAFAWSHNRSLPSSSLTPLPLELHRTGHKEIALRFAGSATSVSLSIGSMLAWFADPEAIFGMQGVLWLSGICLLIVSCARWRGASNITSSTQWSRAEAATFAGLLSLACITYLIALNDVPWRFHYDEAIAYLEAMRFYKGPPISLFTTTWHDTSLPSLWFALSGTLMHMGGTGLGGVRLGVALVGVLTVIPVYGLGRLILGRAGATIAALSLATAPVAIHYSRVSIINSTTALAWAVCFYFLLKGISSNRPTDFAWAGLSAGLSMYTYYGARLLPYLLLVFVAYLALFHFKLFKDRLVGMALLPVGFVVGFGPLLAYFIRSPETWAGRGLSSLNVPLTLPTTWDGWTSIFQTLAPLLRLNFLSLSVIPSADNVYWGTFLQPVEVALLAIGLGALVWRWRQPASFLILIWGLSVVFVGGTLIDAAHIPAFAHWTPAFPAFFIAICIGPGLWLRSLQYISRELYLAGLIVASLGLAVLASANLYYYFITYPSRVQPSFEAAQGRLLESLEPRHRVLFVGNAWQPFYTTIGEMVAPEIDASDLLNPSRSLPLILDGRDLVFVFNEDEVQYLPTIQNYYPGGTAGSIQTPGGPIASTYVVSATAMQDKYGVNLDLASTNGVTWSGVVQQVGALPTDITTAYPLTATWSGAFFVDGDEAVSFSIEGLDESGLAIWLQDSRVPVRSQVFLNRGWIPFSFQAKLSRSTKLGLFIQQGDQMAHEVGTGSLWPLKTGSGLAVTNTGKQVSHRIDPFIGASMLGGQYGPDASVLLDRDPNFVALAPSGGGDLIRWEGEVYAEGGRYNMELRTDGHARLTIDGAEMINICKARPDLGNDYVPGGYVAVRGGYPTAVNSIELSAGWHHVRLDLQAAGRTNGLEWTWTRPDGVREIVPPSRLRHKHGAWPDHPQKIGCTK